MYMYMYMCINPMKYSSYPLLLNLSPIVSLPRSNVQACEWSSGSSGAGGTQIFGKSGGKKSLETNGETCTEVGISEDT